MNITYIINSPHFLLILKHNVYLAISMKTGQRYCFVSRPSVHPHLDYIIYRVIATDWFIGRYLYL
jgi:hypothetical protein